MESLVHLEELPQNFKTLPQNEDSLNLEAAFAAEIALLRKEKLLPRPEAIRNLLKVLEETAIS